MFSRLTGSQPENFAQGAAPFAQTFPNKLPENLNSPQSPTSGPGRVHSFTCTTVFARASNTVMTTQESCSPLP